MEPNIETKLLALENLIIKEMEKLKASAPDVEERRKCEKLEQTMLNCITAGKDQARYEHVVAEKKNDNPAFGLYRMFVPRDSNREAEFKKGMMNHQRELLVGMQLFSDMQWETSNKQTAHFVVYDLFHQVCKLNESLPYPVSLTSIQRDVLEKVSPAPEAITQKYRNEYKVQRNETQDQKKEEGNEPRP